MTDPECYGLPPLDLTVLVPVPGTWDAIVEKARNRRRSRRALLLGAAALAIAPPLWLHRHYRTAQAGPSQAPPPR